MTGEQRISESGEGTKGRAKSGSEADSLQNHSLSLAQRPFPIVGIGASAGGLAAFEAFFSAIPRDAPTGMAFVLVQHLPPDHKSMLVELIRRYTPMDVCEVEDGMPVLPDCAYIIPPNQDMALFNGKLHLLEPHAPRALRLPIDFFFRSLADDQHERAICIVLSGTGSDGTLGARAIKGEGGLVMVQSLATAAYDGMPRSVIAAGVADLVLAPAEMPERLHAYLAHAFGKGRKPRSVPAATEEVLSKVCLMLRDATRHDFSEYKQNTLLRRIERRMALHQIERQKDYLRYLQTEPLEVQALFRDLLIGVTSFFRDPEAFAALEADVIPKLFAGKPTGSPVRIWVCGCSTGEEAYSIAILVHEHLEFLKRSYQVRIFATDVDALAIEQARSGVYPASIATDLTPERLKRYFSVDADTGVYRIHKSVRDHLIFSEQDLIRDPPFSRIDLVSCRNLLIYLNAQLQRKVIPLFHYALNPKGVLFLGSSETVGDAVTLFSCLNRKWRLYVRLETGTAALATTIGDVAVQGSALLPPAPLEAGDSSPPGHDVRALTERRLLEHFNAVGVLVNAVGEICYIHGRTGRYLEPAAGTATMNVLQMARDGLRRPLTAAIQHTVARQEVTRAPGLKVKSNGDDSEINLVVYPVKSPWRAGAPEGRADFYLIVFEPLVGGEGEPRVVADDSDAAPPRSDRKIAELEQELCAKEEYLQTTLEEMETSNEELKSTNEEMQSVNEELQSTNEELETSKEELQSVNEELATVNADLQVKVNDLSRANDDMNNLLAGTGVATLFIDEDHRISRFTPAMTKIIKLIPSDIGRPIGDIACNLVDYAELSDDIDRVLRTLVPQEQTVHTGDGIWFLMRIGPYRTLSNVIEGVVITFVDITSRKRMEDELRDARCFGEEVAEVVSEPLVTLDAQAVLCWANRAFYRCFQLTEPAVLGKPLFELDEGRWDSPALRQLIDRLQTQGAEVAEGEDQVCELELEVAGQGRRIMRLDRRGISPGNTQSGAFLLAFADQGPAMASADAGDRSGNGGEHGPTN